MDEAGEVGRDAGDEGGDGAPVDAVGVAVDAAVGEKRALTRIEVVGWGREGCFCCWERGEGGRKGERERDVGC